MSTFFGIQMAGRQGNLLLLRKIFPYSDLGIVLIGDNIGFYIVSLVGQVIFNIFVAFSYMVILFIFTLCVPLLLFVNLFAVC